jgi:oligopeptide/dipeptide ABC transporter ATP-binding protein
MECNEKYLDIIERRDPEAAQREKVLQVKNLRISFKTDNGKVQAVRGVSFDLYKGETLCIVGESGSGKSVTSKAIMGILSANAIIEGGQIIYEGEDLLKVSEDEFHRIRGHKIGMIFQDPLSSLNPIMKIGKQITEAMLINRNQLKNRYNDLIAKELVAYKNNKSIMNASVSMAEAEFNIKKSESEARLAPFKSSADAAKVALDQAKSQNKGSQGAQPIDVASAQKGYEDAKAAYDREVLEEKNRMEQAKAECKAKKDAAIKAYKEKDPALKAALEKRKKEAKGEIKAYKEEITKKKDEDVKAIDAKIAQVHIDQKAVQEIDQKIRLIRLHYEPLIWLNYFSMKRKTKIQEQEDKELKPWKEKRLTYTKEYDELQHQKELILRDYQNKIKTTKAEAKRRAIEVMKEVGIPQAEKRFYQYPFEFSGGMRQRIVIAIALIADPDILICDEPTTALDVTIQAQILELINKLKRDRHLSCIFITHDLGVVANMADRIAVMYAGKICEYGTENEIFYDPHHPYTWALLSSIPDIDSKEKLEAIPGTPPDMIFPPVGDAFAPRNRYAIGLDLKYQPPYFRINDTHYAATWLLYKDAPKVDPPKIVTTRIAKALENERKEEEKNASK